MRWGVLGGFEWSKSAHAEKHGRKHVFFGMVIGGPGLDGFRTDPICSNPFGVWTS